MKEYKLGFIGCGHMGFAIAKGIKDKDLLASNNIYIYDINKDIQSKCSNEGFIISEDLESLCTKSEIVLLATTPQHTEPILEEIKDYEVDNILSIVTGLSTSHIKEYLPNTYVVRAMPNTPLQVGCGATVLCSSDNNHEDIYEYIKTLLGSIGLVEEIPEEQFPLLVSAHGSTPAYFYYFVECILEDLKERGMDEKVARRLLVETLIGSGELLKADEEKPLSEFVDAVCSKGGTTIQAITHFRENNLKDLVKDANDKCINRAKEFEK